VDQAAGAGARRLARDAFELGEALTRRSCDGASELKSQLLGWSGSPLNVRKEDAQLMSAISSQTSALSQRRLFRHVRCISGQELRADI
jgi:hypothetical protein